MSEEFEKKKERRNEGGRKFEFIIYSMKKFNEKNYDVIMMIMIIMTLFEG